MTIEVNQVQRMLEWLKTKLHLNILSEKAKLRKVKRGQVYRCNFGCGVGSEMQKDRPAVILQNNIGNSKSGNTIVVPITHNTSVLPCMANITPKIDTDGNIILDGQVNVSNIMCVSKARLGDYICALPRSDMKLIDRAIAQTIGLMKYYTDLHKRLDDKLTYIDRLKSERNLAQDELAEIRKILGISEEDSIINIIENMKKSLDK